MTNNFLVKTPKQYSTKKNPKFRVLFLSLGWELFEKYFSDNAKKGLWNRLRSVGTHWNPG